MFRRTHNQCAMLFRDTLTFDADARICADGSLVAEVFAARTGIQDYLGLEVDPDNLRGLRDRENVRVYRPESEVFKADSLASFSAAPVTVDHPSTPVTADNWKRLGVGEIHGDVIRDGERVRVPIIIRDATAVAKATSSHKQLSMGYATNLVFPTDGKHPDGTACDAFQTDIRINHIALVKAARGGPELRVVDERPIPKEPRNMSSITIDGLPVKLDDAEQVKAVIVKLQGQIATADEAKAKALTDLAAMTTEKVALDGQIADLTKQVADAAMTPAKLRDAAKAYAVVADKAKALGVKFADDADEVTIRRAVVDAQVGELAKEWTDEQVSSAFAAIKTDTKPGVVAFAPKMISNDAATSLVAARAKRNAAVSTAYRANQGA